MCGFLGLGKLSENKRGLLMGTGFLWGNDENALDPIAGVIT